MQITWNFPKVTVHPAAAAFPLVNTDELDALVEDIRANGLTTPLTQTGDGRLLSGRARYAACQKLSIEPRYTIYRGNPWTFVIRENMETRHMTEQQRAMTGGRMMIYKRPQNMVPNRDTLAKMLDVSGRAVSRASIVIRKAIPEIVELVDENLMFLTTAERVAPLEHEAQLNMAQSIRAGKHVNKVAPPAPAYGMRDIKAKARKQNQSSVIPLKVATTTAAFLIGIADQLEGKEIIATPEDLRDARQIATDLTRGALALRKLRHIIKRQIDILEDEENGESLDA